MKRGRQATEDDELVLKPDTPLPPVMGSERAAGRRWSQCEWKYRAWAGPELWCSGKLSALGTAGAWSELDPGPALPIATH